MDREDVITRKAGQIMDAVVAAYTLGMERGRKIEHDIDDEASIPDDVDKCLKFIFPN